MIPTKTDLFISCASCGHNKVCQYKEAYGQLLIDFDSKGFKTYDVFEVTIICKHFYTLNTNFLRKEKTI